MSLLWHHIAQLWREKKAFKGAALYLIAVLLVIVLLPVLPLPFEPQDQDLGQLFLSPFDGHVGNTFHVLGTDALGRDLFVNLLYGARTAFFISIPVMALTAIIGVALGAAAGLYGNNSASLSWAQLILIAIGLLTVSYYGIYVPAQVASLGLGMNKVWLSLATAGILLLFLQLVLLRLLTRIPFFRKRFTVPVDNLVLRLIEIFTSIPMLILLLVLASFTPSSLLLVSCLLVLTYWTGIARLTRAEMLRIKQLPFFEAATSIGVKRSSLMLRHAFPNMLGPIVVSFMFGVAGLMALESTLSFLGIGVSGNFVSWGSIISGIRSNLSAWWLVLFPGAFLALTVLALQTCSYFILNKIRNN